MESNIKNIAQLEAHAKDKFPETFCKLPSASALRFKVGHGKDPNASLLWVGQVHQNEKHVDVYACIDDTDDRVIRFLTLPHTVVDEETVCLAQPFCWVNTVYTGGPSDPKHAHDPLRLFVQYCLVLGDEDDGLRFDEYEGYDIGLDFELLCWRLAQGQKAARDLLGLDGIEPTHAPPQISTK
ncbi:hypothetical protein NX059_000939 [Plenodomus lindquistii]|nr:hypothetical protein NX059_000939 [Plenodomus lindquistii]